MKKILLASACIFALATPGAFAQRTQPGGGASSQGNVGPGAPEGAMKDGTMPRSSASKKKRGGWRIEIRNDPCYGVVEGAPGRVVDEPTVVLGAELSAMYEPVQGAHMMTAAIKATAPIPAITPVPSPRSGLL